MLVQVARPSLIVTGNPVCKPHELVRGQLALILPGAIFARLVDAEDGEQLAEASRFSKLACTIKVHA